MDNNQVVKNIQSLELGDHISCIYRTDEELFSLIVPFFITGLQQHNKCIYVFDSHSPEQLTNVFSNFGFDLTTYLEKQDFVFLSKNESYLSDGVFHADAVLATIKNLESQTLKQGYTALRITGDESWVKTNNMSTSAFMKYEARISNAIQDCAIIALCQYRESLFDEKVLIDVLRTHEIVYLYNKFVRCNYYAPSDNFIPLSNDNEFHTNYASIIESLSAQQ